MLPHRKELIKDKRRNTETYHVKKANNAAPSEFFSLILRIQAVSGWPCSGCLDKTSPYCGHTIGLSALESWRPGLTDWKRCPSRPVLSRGPRGAWRTTRSSSGPCWSRRSRPSWGRDDAARLAARARGWCCQTSSQSQVPEAAHDPGQAVRPAVLAGGTGLLRLHKCAVSSWRP